MSGMSAAIPHVVLGILLAASAARAEANESQFQAFSRPASIKLLPASKATAEVAISSAQAAIAASEALLDAKGTGEGGIGRLNGAAGGGPQVVDGQVLDILERALSFCAWSDGIGGPLGGRLYSLWGLREPISALPVPEDLDLARESAACDRLVVDRKAGTAELGAGSRIDLWGFATGFAVDRAVAALKEAGVESGFVSIGTVARAFGPGPGGRGWAIVPPGFPGLEQPLQELWLDDLALAAASMDDGLLGAGGERYAPYLDQRKGRPAEGVVAVLASTELAVDAQALSTVLFATGSRAGQLRLGNLTPRPAVLWLLGSGEGHPLIVEYHWGELMRAADGTARRP
jgi:thiamine biosynthesis lipoprotein